MEEVALYTSDDGMCYAYEKSNRPSELEIIFESLGESDKVLSLAICAYISNFGQFTRSFRTFVVTKVGAFGARVFGGDMNTTIFGTRSPVLRNVS